LILYIRPLVEKFNKPEKSRAEELFMTTSELEKHRYLLKCNFWFFLQTLDVSIFGSYLIGLQQEDNRSRMLCSYLFKLKNDHLLSLSSNSNARSPPGN
jgi:hypothetical protein